MSLVLLSGGLDSAVLLAHEARAQRVDPVYVRVGLAWEDAERAMLRRLLAAPALRDRVASLSEVGFDMRDVYGPKHWAVTGIAPGYDSADEEVYLTGRNLVLLTKAGVLAAQRRLSRLVLGPLSANPFPDATPAFFAAMSAALSQGLAAPMTVEAPFLTWTKADVIRLGATLAVPFELTLSCMQPAGGPWLDAETEGALPVHCGDCNKCRERRDAFADAGVSDPTPYARFA